MRECVRVDRNCFGIVAILLLLTTQTPKWLAVVVINLAQINVVHGQDGVSLVQQAFSLAPESPLVRLHMAAALKDTDAVLATRILSSVPPLYRNERIQRLLLTTSVASGKINEATELYEAVIPPPRLSAQTSAALVVQQLSSHGAVSESLAHLLADALGLKYQSNEYQLLVLHMQQPGFWMTEAGQRTRGVLEQRAHSRSLFNNGELYQSDIFVSQQLANALGVSQDELHLGPELVVNSSFESLYPESEMPQGWVPSFATTGNPWNRAVFAIGIDDVRPFAGACSLRIDGLIIEHDTVHEAARAGLAHRPITLEPMQPYSISFAYRTASDLDPMASVWVSPDGQILYAGELFLPPTHDLWKRVTVVAWNQSPASVTITPIVRAWSEGTVWFDDFSTRAILTESLLVRKEIFVLYEESTTR